MLKNNCVLKGSQNLVFGNFIIKKVPYLIKFFKYEHNLKFNQITILPTY